MKETVIEFFRKYLEYDKLLHFFVGFCIFIVVTFWLTDIYSLLVVTIIAVLNELYDKYIRKTEISYLDIGFTVLPAIILTILN